MRHLRPVYAYSRIDVKTLEEYQERPRMPPLSERAYFYSVQGLAVEWIAHRLGIATGTAIQLIQDGKQRSEAAA